MEKCTAEHFTDCLSCEYDDCIRKRCAKNKIIEPDMNDYIPQWWINESRVEEFDEDFNCNYTDYNSDN